MAVAEQEKQFIIMKKIVLLSVVFSLLFSSFCYGADSTYRINEKDIDITIDNVKELKELLENLKGELLERKENAQSSKIEEGKTLLKRKK